MDDLQFLSIAMDAHSFRFAKSMPAHPHWYTLRHEWRSAEDFERCVQIIRDRGVVEYWFSKPYTKLELGGFRYWSMGAPLDKTILINRARA